MYTQELELGDGFRGLTCGDQGPGVIWIHGYTLDSSIWSELWRELPGYRHIGVDLPNHGRSAPFRPDESLLSLSDRVGALAHRFSATSIVALSFGTLIAIGAAIEHPTRFESLIVGSPTLGGVTPEAGIRALYSELTKLHSDRGAGPWMTDLWTTVPPDIFKGASKQPSLYQSLRDIVARHSWTELSSGVMKEILEEPLLEARLRTICARTLILVGDEDMSPYKRAAEVLRRSVSRSKRVHLPGAGHLCLIEDPTIAANYIRQHLGPGLDG